jgi:hypothetical protein
VGLPAYSGQTYSDDNGPKEEEIPANKGKNGFGSNIEGIGGTFDPNNSEAVPGAEDLSAGQHFRRSGAVWYRDTSGLCTTSYPVLSAGPLGVGKALRQHAGRGGGEPRLLVVVTARSNYKTQEEGGPDTLVGTFL